MARCLYFGWVVSAVGLFFNGASSVAYAQTCPQPGDQGFESRCTNPPWGPRLYLPDDIQERDQGFPLNIALWWGLGPADLPPCKLSGPESSLPLLPADEQYFRGPNAYPERPVHKGLIDLVTGSPLYQELDFELPFGGAVLRHVRTTADNVTHRYDRSINDSSYGIAAAPYWDWNGQFWVMGDNPILLIDACYKEINCQENPGGTPICDQITYFIPDAHHAIPFRKLENGAYAPAEPWFDAVLEYSGETPPEYYYVYLDRRSVKYTFQAYYEDVGTATLTGCDNNSDLCVGPCQYNECEISAHETPCDGGLGTPYYGLLTEIEDRNGNRVDIHYVGQQNEDCEFGDWDCCQNCNEKGQIDYIKLYAYDGDNDAEWTLIYTHRPFTSVSDPELAPYNPQEVNIDTKHLWYAHQLHSIHVYEGDISIYYDYATLPLNTFYGEPVYEDGCYPYTYECDPMDPNVICTAYHTSAPCYPAGYGNELDSFDDYDAIDTTQIRGLPDNWTMRVNPSVA